jgi:ABC-2 type transport system ATP-binding protein
MSAVSFSGLKKSYFQPAVSLPIVALEDLSLEVAEGVICGFVGLNGAGKTTALRILLGHAHSDCGTATILGGQRAEDIPHRYGFAPEIPDLPGFLSVEELLEYSCVLTGVDASDELIDRAINLLELHDERHRRVGELSKGTRQRVSLACSIVHRPQLVLWDEPSSGLDPLGRKLVKDVIRRLNSEGATIFFSTHILSDIPGLCHHIGIINRGRCIFSGSLPRLCESGSGSDIEECFEALLRSDREKKAEQVVECP